MGKLFKDQRLNVLNHKNQITVLLVTVPATTLFLTTLLYRLPILSYHAYILFYRRDNVIYVYVYRALILPYTYHAIILSGLSFNFYIFRLSYHVYYFMLFISK